MTCERAHDRGRAPLVRLDAYVCLFTTEEVPHHWIHLHHLL